MLSFAPSPGEWHHDQDGSGGAELGQAPGAYRDARAGAEGQDTGVTEVGLDGRQDGLSGGRVAPELDHPLYDTNRAAEDISQALHLAVLVGLEVLLVDRTEAAELNVAQPGAQPLFDRVEDGVQLVNGGLQV